MRRHLLAINASALALAVAPSLALGAQSNTAAADAAAANPPPPPSRAAAATRPPRTPAAPDRRRARGRPAGRADEPQPADLGTPRPAEGGAWTSATRPPRRRRPATRPPRPEKGGGGGSQTATNTQIVPIAAAPAVAPQVIPVNANIPVNVLSDAPSGDVNRTTAPTPTRRRQHRRLPEHQPKARRPPRRTRVAARRPPTRRSSRSRSPRPSPARYSRSTPTSRSPCSRRVAARRRQGPGRPGPVERRLRRRLGGRHGRVAPIRLRHPDGDARSSSRSRSPRRSRRGSCPLTRRPDHGQRPARGAPAAPGRPVRGARRPARHGQRSRPSASRPPAGRPRWPSPVCCPWGRHRPAAVPGPAGPAPRAAGLI